MVAQTLGSRDSNDDDIDILNEDSDGNVLFCPTIEFNLYEKLHSHEKLVVPYNVIKVCKSAKEKGLIELLLVLGDRPDQIPTIKSMLELWGFDSFIDYVYSIAELGFLEGLLPTLQASFLSPQEIQRVKEIVSCLRFRITEDILNLSSSIDNGNLKILMKNLEWALKLKVPVAISIDVRSSVSMSLYQDILIKLQNFSQEYELLTEINMNFLDNMSKDFQKTFVKAFLAYSFELFSSNVPISMKIHPETDIPFFLSLGIRDFSSVIFHYFSYSQNLETPFDEFLLLEKVRETNLCLAKRFPLHKSFIKHEKYSKKLGQVFDAYRYRIKKEKDKSSKSKKV